MNEKVDLTKILKDCPEGTKFYSPLCGKVVFKCIKDSIIYTTDSSNSIQLFSKEGFYYYSAGVECLLFPSKEQRDWDKFKAPWYKKEIEPKFHIGQYITDGYIGGPIISIEDNYTCYKISDFMKGTNIIIPITLQNNYHLWTIQDAKDGDVLAFSNDTIVIFKDSYNSTSFHSYCHIEDGIFDFNKDEIPDWWNSKGFKPATKEQRDLLSQKIKEAGYKWDTETKTLEKLIKPKFKVGDKIVNVFMRYRGTLGTILKITDDKYIFTDGRYILISNQNSWDLVPDKFDPKTL